MKLLCIGNEIINECASFLPELAKAAGKELLLGILYADGSNAEDHYRNYIDENEVYNYRVFLEGETEPMMPEGIAVHEAVEDDSWDMVIIQQEPALAGVKETMSPYVAELAGYIALMHPGAKVMIFEPFAFDKGCAVPEFSEYYGRDTETMYESIAQCCAEIAEEAEAAGVVRCGRGFEILRKTKLASHLTLDGRMPTEPAAFAASCVIYESLFDESAEKSPFILPGYDEAVTNLIKVAVSG